LTPDRTGAIMQLDIHQLEALLGSAAPQPWLYDLFHV
jgi:hypothetical protein